MERSITISIDNISAARFSELWKANYTPEIYEQATKIILTISLEKEIVLDELARFAEQQGLNYHIFYQAYNFEPADIERAPLLEIFSGTLPGEVTIVEGHPITRTHCPICESIVERWNHPAGEIVCTAKRKPKSPVISDEVGFLFFHRALIDAIREAGYANGLELMPCAISCGNEVDRNYFWPYSAISTGPPSGKIVYDTCGQCGTKIVRHRRDFVTHYDRTRWNQSDFAASDYQSALLISHRVFKLLREKIPSKEFGKLAFTPCMLD